VKLVFTINVVHILKDIGLKFIFLKQGNGERVTVVKH